ncbi:MAG: flagellar hook assembly protein FlgD [Pseudomonadota bacterium]
MNIDTTGVLSAAGISTPAKAAKEEKSLDANAFLTLMTSQLRNQDPLKPLDGNAFLAQLAQFSSVQGIQELNAGFRAFAESAAGSGALEGAALIGRSVLVPADTFTNTGSGVKGELDVPMSGNVTVEVVGAGGAVVRRMQISGAGAGSLPFAWDGRTDTGATAPTGEYTLVARVANDRRTEAIAPQLSARVDSVSLTSSGPVLNLGGLGATPITAVTRIGNN